MMKICSLLLSILISSCAINKGTISSYDNKETIAYKDLTISKIDSEQLIEKFNTSSADYLIFLDFTRKTCSEIPIKMEKIKNLMKNAAYKSELVILFSENKINLSRIHNEYGIYAEYDLPREIYYLDIDKYKGSANDNMSQLLEELNLNPLYLKSYYIYDKNKEVFLDSYSF